MLSQTAQFKRRHYFIDRKFQGRYMATFFIPMVIMLGFMLGTLYFAARSIVDTTSRMLSRDVENTMTLALQDKISPSVEEYRTALAAVSRTARTFSQSSELKREMLTTLLWVFGIGLFLVIIQIVLLTVFFSHKVAGPIYRFECLLHECVLGRYTGSVKLRHGDEMQRLAVLFNDAIQTTRRRLRDLVNAESDERRKEIASMLQL